MLDRAVSEHDPFVADLKVSPAFHTFREDPRMNVLLRRIGLR